MTRRTDSPSSRASFREEAATWFAAMRGPDADGKRGEFEAWLAEDRRNLEAYNRIAETFSMGKALSREMLEDGANTLPHQARPAKTIRGSLIAAAIAILAATALALVWAGMSTRTSTDIPQIAQSSDASSASRAAPERLATRIGEIREFRLADGSTVILDTGSEVLVTIGPERRDITLTKGRARFAVAHEARPFLVTAGGGWVRAVGTLFDVDLTDDGRVNVRLLGGAIDVDPGPLSARTKQVRRLAAGEAISFGGRAETKFMASAAAGDADWPRGIRDFDAVRLDDVLVDANRYAAAPVYAASPDVAGLRISGTFRIDNTEELAANIADVLGLAQVSGPGGIALMRECPPSSQQNCRPPS
jgi:transmembrane sensor